ncbi:hypothetical protein CAEBREN_06749 [Caenorhabditis brenneri]|uniref:Uncharacterized protein n=1 Tax=Caenorhabditis brenneri TaxID=135651 RepID=G0NM51_CAEBE|nr:hypothetical protein CAEBREN_06749 [Caenorhabditis brenneri]
MKSSGPYTSVTSTSSASTHQYWPSTQREPPAKFQKMSMSSSSAPNPYPTTGSLKMKAMKKQSPKATAVLPPLPSITTFFDSGSSSHSSSSNSSYGSYCQFSPEGSYTVYHLPMNYIPYTGEPTTTQSTSTSAMASPAPLMNSPPMSADEHKPVYEPLFIQTSDYPYYSNTDPNGGYPSSATINANQLLLRPIPNTNR